MLQSEIAASGAWDAVLLDEAEDALRWEERLGAGAEIWAVRAPDVRGPGEPAKPLVRWPVAPEAEPCTPAAGPSGAQSCGAPASWDPCQRLVRQVSVALGSVAALAVQPKRVALRAASWEALRC